MRLHPLPQTLEALRELVAGGDVSLALELFTVAERVRDLVPDLTGLSLGLVDENVTLTLVASAEEVAALDAAQYVDGGPCVESAETGGTVETATEELLDEGRWLMYASAGAASGVASSLTLSITDDGQVVGTVNLYASSPDAFEGRHDEIAEAVGSAPDQAVANADLSMRTVEQAIEAPARIRAGDGVNVAVGIIAERHGVTVAEARERLRQGAARAGISEEQAARAITQISG